MPKFRTNEPPEQASTGLVGLVIIAGMLAIVIALFVETNPLEGRALQARVFVPNAVN